MDKNRRDINSCKLPKLKYLILKSYRQIFLVFVILLINGCIQQFVPEISEDQNILVVEGLLTDQPGQNTIKISTSLPVGGGNYPKPLRECTVTISDDLGNICNLEEKVAGLYTTNPPFQGVVGRTYTLHINTNESHYGRNYTSFPLKMKPVPPIDSIYHDKVVLTRMADGWPTGEGCQIYLNTYDPQNICKYFRWEYAETWEILIPYHVPNNRCWVTNYSDRINIKNTDILSEGRIERLPINLVTNESDRLRVRYSILVNQYSINEEEYNYWEKIKAIVEETGSLYDITPSSISSNIECIEKPGENVLGYFSVSAVKSKRIFINDQFRGTPDLYKDCEQAVVPYYAPIPGLNESVWVIIDQSWQPPRKVVTYTKGCADCTVRGTNIMPDYWINDK
jgi:hypothetical protein